MSDWTPLIRFDDIEAGDVTRVDVGGRKLAIHDTGEGLFVTDALCTHGGADLADGYLDGCTIECPLHQGCFDVRDGRALFAPAVRPLKTWPVRVEAGLVQVRLSASRASR